MEHGGDRIAEVLTRQGVAVLFTLCGGHISPILTAARARGLRVIDTRNEATAVFAADAAARLTGIPGVAAVTAGPGLTNTITAVKNAQMARSPVIVLGGATATILKGRGALQDIDQMALMRPHVKWAASASSVGRLVTLLEQAFAAARSDVPGPVFLECPVDLLYAEPTVRDLYAPVIARRRTLRQRVESWYVQRHLTGLFADADTTPQAPAVAPSRQQASSADVTKAAGYLAKAERPVVLVGSQAMEAPGEVRRLADAVVAMGVPVYLSGMARGLLGPDHPLWLRHRRKDALREADTVILAGVPCDFRLDYGRHIAGGATVIAVNRDRAVIAKNRRPTLGVEADPDLFVRDLAPRMRGLEARFAKWANHLRERDAERAREIRDRASKPADMVNPLHLCREIDRALPDDSIVVADGGDFVATASYTVRPRRPLSWLDPGAFGTLGVGAGFALGAAAVRPGAEIWLLLGDGAAGYGLVEFDTFVRHGVPVIAVLGNDGSWAQIAREQVPLLGDDVGTVLRRSDYHTVVEGLGGRGLVVRRNDEVAEALRRAHALACEGTPVLVNAHLAATDFRKGSISM